MMPRSDHTACSSLYDRLKSSGFNSDLLFFGVGKNDGEPKVSSEECRHEVPKREIGRVRPSQFWSPGAVMQKIFEILHANLYILVLFLRSLFRPTISG